MEKNRGDISEENVAARNSLFFVSDFPLGEIKSKRINQSSNRLSRLVWRETRGAGVLSAVLMGSSEIKCKRLEIDLRQMYDFLCRLL